jgi:anti-anti-sigma factor
VTINIRQTENAAILDLKGALKMGESEQAFRDKVSELLKGGAKNLAVNLTGVTDMDSSGVGALMRAYTSCRRVGGKCRFFAAPKRIMQLLKMVRLDTVLELMDDEASALSGL